jgi:hypothetical protein
MAGGLIGLGPDEHLVASAAVSFRGAAVASSQSMLALGSARARMRHYDAWRTAAAQAGFPTAGPEMVIGVTEERLVVCRTTFWLGRADRVEAGISLRDIADVAVTRHGLVTGLAFVLTNGAIIEVEAMLGRRLRRFGTVLREKLAQHRS